MPKQDKPKPPEVRAQNLIGSALEWLESVRLCLEMAAIMLSEKKPKPRRRPKREG